MANLKCDKCNHPAEVQEPIGHLCYPCWLSEYMKLSRKETQRYGNGFSNRSIPASATARGLN